MPLDGIVISNITHDLKQAVLGGRIDKIHQPEKDELIVNIRSLGNNYKLLLTAHPSHPRIHFTNTSKPNPITAPLFCMVLRKHLGGGKILSVEQPDFERIIEIGVASPNEMGDTTYKRLIIEIMGKHSNIILVDERGIILDSARHVNRETSSVREVLPGKPYHRPPSQGKANPLEFIESVFLQQLAGAGVQELTDFLVQSYSGISPLAAKETCHRAGLSPDTICANLNDNQAIAALHAFEQVMGIVSTQTYRPEIISKSGKFSDFHSIDLTLFDGIDGYEKILFGDISSTLEYFYAEKDARSRIDQKTADLRKLIQNNIERCAKKHDTHIRTMREIANRESHKLKGELITASIHLLKQGMTVFAADNYYADMLDDGTFPTIEIELDPNLDPAENAQKHFKRYNKEKRTFVALQEQMVATDQEREYLQSLLHTLSTCRDEADITQVREELAENGYIKKHKKAAKPVKAKPLHYTSSDGADIFVGKNNKQNDELTLKIADNRDIWLHVKDMPGSHVLIKSGGAVPSDTTLEEAAMLAAYYSKAKSSSNVPIDYTQRKNVRKPSGAKPGMVIYENFKTIFVTPDENVIKNLKTL
ncbi:MAG: NFACT family protein [Defluviitaleaceae bacterium]|nr:NFACT family protein [Defluviitaleaceae bacterium]